MIYGRFWAQNFDGKILFNFQEIFRIRTFRHCFGHFMQTFQASSPNLAYYCSLFSFRLRSPQFPNGRSCSATHAIISYYVTNYLSKSIKKKKTKSCLPSKAHKIGCRDASLVTKDSSPHVLIDGKSFAIFL